MIGRFLGHLLDRLADPAPRLGIDLAILAGAAVAFRIAHLGILILEAAPR